MLMTQRDLDNLVALLERQFETRFTELQDRIKDLEGKINEQKPSQRQSTSKSNLRRQKSELRPEGSVG